jgi:hypothetical protein
MGVDRKRRWIAKRLSMLVESDQQQSDGQAEPILCL